MKAKDSLKISRLVALYLGFFTLYILLPDTLSPAKTVLSGLLAITLAVIFVAGVMTVTRS